MVLIVTNVARNVSTRIKVLNSVLGIVIRQRTGGTKYRDSILNICKDLLVSRKHPNTLCQPSTLLYNECL
jgi:hypothetical protein